MRFRLITIAYGFALVAAGMAATGPAAGVVAAALILICWHLLFRIPWHEPLGVWRTSGVVAAVLLIASGAVAFELFRSVTPVIESLSADANCRYQASLTINALASYRRGHGSFPPLVVRSQSGSPLHSWRTLILPYLDSSYPGNVAGPYDPSEPWDSDTNTSAARTIPAAYRCPAAQHDPNGGSPTDASYLRVHADDDPEHDAFPWPILIEVSRSGILWTEPRDISLSDAVKLLTTRHNTGHYSAQDGYLTVDRLTEPVRIVVACEDEPLFPQSGPTMVARFDDPQDAVALFNALNDAPRANKILNRQPNNAHVSGIHWQRLYGVAAFLAVALAPGPALLRRRKVEADRMAVPDDSSTADRSPLDQPKN